MDSHPEKSAADRRLPQLDGLRGTAILLVLIHHFGLPLPGWLDWGPVAPSIFFMLSGYLITNSLMKLRAGPGGAALLGGLLQYHARRFSRLIPALYVLLAVGWLAGMPEFREDLAWHAAFFSNVLMAVNDEWLHSLSHLWSLAVQEQFYLVWPVILFLPTRCMPWALAGAFAGAALFRLWCLHAGTSEFFRWFMMPGSLDDFATGGLVAWAMQKKGEVRLIPAGWTLPTGLVAAACWVVSRWLRGYYLHEPSHWGIAFVETFQSVFFAWLLICLFQHARSPWVKVFAFPPLVYTGRISYGLFLWHMFVLFSLGPYLDAAGLGLREHPFLRCFVLMVASFVVAGLSWATLESPFIAWSRRLGTSAALRTAWRRLLTKFPVQSGGI